MNKELTKTWNNVLKAIRTEVSQANYGFLFKQTHLVSLDDNIATIGAPSVMIINLLQSRFLKQIKSILDAQLGKSVDVLFIAKSLPMPELQAKDAPLFGAEVEKKSSEKNRRRTGQNEEYSSMPGGETQTNYTTNRGSLGTFGGMNIGHLPRVRPDFTFSNFAVSTTNQLAFVSAQNVAQNIGRSYNPFFIYGPVGVGKTHLMHAIANEVYRREPSKKIIYITSEEFTNEVVEAIKNNETAKMKRRFRSAYLLLIDDIQFIEGKDKVQEELFHTFNILIDNGSQIALSSDRPPQEIKKLEKRLSSRFAGGLTVDIEAPDFELKAAIILIKAKKYGYDLPIDVAKLLAEKAEDTRSLEGLLLRIITQAGTTGDGINYSLAEKVIGGVIEEKREHLHSDDIIKEVCSYYNVKTTQLKGPRREASLVRARQVAMYLLKNELGLTQVEIGNLLGGRDHTTIMHGVDKIRTLVENKSPIDGDIRRIVKQIKG